MEKIDKDEVLLMLIYIIQSNHDAMEMYILREHY
jgi:hypothetical protein